MLEYMKLESGAPGYLERWPQACICGSQKGPMVDTFIDAPGYGLRGMEPGRIYICRLCAKRIGIAFGIVKGAEMERLEGADDRLGQMQKEVDERQGLIETLSASLAAKDAKLEAQQGYIETLQAEAASRKHLAELIASSARELTAA